MNDFDVVTGPAPSSLPEQLRPKPAVPRVEPDGKSPSPAHLREREGPGRRPGG
jgi:hypothetical protein